MGAENEARAQVPAHMNGASMSDERIETEPGVNSDNTAMEDTEGTKAQSPSDIQADEPRKPADDQNDDAPEEEPTETDAVGDGEEPKDGADGENGADAPATIEEPDKDDGDAQTPAEAAEDQPDAEKVDEVEEGSEEDLPSAEDADEDTASSLPDFLVRDEDGNFGDDPEPLPEGFEVIEGGAATSTAAPAAVAQPEPETAPHEPEEPKGPSAAEALTHAAAEAASTVGTYISQGVGAVREMSAAKRAHAEARDMLEELEQRIADQTDELAHRRDVTERYPQIVSDLTTRKKGAQASINAAVALQKTIQAQIETLKKQLDDMKAADAATEKRLKSALEAAERKEEEARDSANRMKRRLADAQRGVEKAREAATSSIETAQHAVEAASAHLNTLREEYSEIQRNPSANSAAYSIRDTELSGEIADATEALRRANEELPRVQKAAKASLEAAQAAVAEAERPINEAKEAFRLICDQTVAARDELEAARKDAADRQKAAKAKVAEQERSLKEQQEQQAAGEREIEEADRAIADAASIHDHPEVTERIAAALSADIAERDELLPQVETLAATEATVRERTRASRLRFIGIIAAAVAIVLVIVTIVLLVF